MADKQIEQILRDLSDLRGYIYNNVDKLQSTIEQSEITNNGSLKSLEFRLDAILQANLDTFWLLMCSVLVFFISISNIVYAAETMVGQVNGMMCIKCQKMVTEALQKACPDATVKVSWPEGVAVSSFADKSNLNEEEYKQAIAGTGFEVVKVIKVGKIIEDPSAAVSLLTN